MPVGKRALAQQWADIETSEVDNLLAEAQRTGWEPALNEYAKSNPFFVKRLRNSCLGNWHALLQRPRGDKALDVGCGFGALLSGLAGYYSTGFGVEMLPERLRFATLRQEMGKGHPLRSPLTRASGHHLPFRDESVDLVTMNGVLEWAAYYVDGHSGRQQLNMLKEIRRVLSPDGTVAVAIENRFALENLVGMRDTHTGVRFVPAMPRFLANLVTHGLTRHSYRTWLYGLNGYRNLFEKAGFRKVTVLDLISSYNDWDFVLDPADTASYRFLWKADWIKSFYPHTERIRRILSRKAPGLLSHINYSYLVLGGQSNTVLDTSHALWEVLARVGILPGAHRFAFRLNLPGSVGVITHDGTVVRNVVLLSPAKGASAADCTSDHARDRLTEMVPASCFEHEGMQITVLVPLG